jgi:hypothetical protein
MLSLSSRILPNTINNNTTWLAGEALAMLNLIFVAIGAATHTFEQRANLYRSAELIRLVI